MATKKLKSYYDTRCARLLGSKIADQWRKFPQAKFVSDIQRGIRGKEFLARQDVFAIALEQYLPHPFAEKIDILEQILGEELSSSSGMFTHGWWLWPVGRLLERNGLEDPDRSLDFIYELTKRFTGEFAIRPILQRHPRSTLKVLQRWSRDKNLHVRRLASEGIRIRLPWAKKLTTFLEYPDECEAILFNLRRDSEKFVQKSVGNNLNDLMKEDKNLAMQIINRWSSDDPLSAHTQWILRHGMRSVSKKERSIRSPK